MYSRLHQNNFLHHTLFTSFEELGLLTLGPEGTCFGQFLPSAQTDTYPNIDVRICSLNCVFVMFYGTFIETFGFHQN